MGQLSKASGATKEAAKGWKSGRSCARLDHVINMARQIDSVRDWLDDEIKRPVDPRILTQVMAHAQQLQQTGSGESVAVGRAIARILLGRKD